MTDDRERWALILGASSGMGEATALALAAAGYNIAGIHLDFRAGDRARRGGQGTRSRPSASEALYVNMNAADDEKRARRPRRRSASASTARAPRAASRTSASSCTRSPSARWCPFLTEDPKAGVDRKKMEMTQDVMANSLVYWVQDLWRGGFLGQGSQDLRDDVRGLDPRRARATASSRRRRRRSSRTSGSWRWSWRGWARASRPTPSGRASRCTPALMKIPEKDAIIEAADEAQPDRADDDARRTWRTRSSRCPARARTSSTARSSASTAASTSPGRSRSSVGPQREGDVPMSGRVLVVGSVNVDLVVQAERLPAPGETVLGGTFSRFHGGKGGNQAVAAARLGVPVMLVAALGDDEFGAEARAALAREGVGTDVLVTLDHTATGVALILVDAKAENQIAVAPGANAGLTAAHVRAALGRLAPHAGDVVIVTHEIPTEAAREALRIGRAGRGVDDPQPGPGRRAGPVGARAGRRADAQPRRAGPPGGRRREALRARDRPCPRSPSGPPRSCSRRPARDPAPARRCSCRSGSTGAVLVRRDGPPIDIKSPEGEGHRRDRCRRRAQRRAGGRAGRRAGPRDGGPARGRGGDASP